MTGAYGGSAGKWYFDLYALFVAMIILAFPIAAVAATLLGISSNALSLASRFLVVGLGLLLLMRNFQRRSVAIPSFLLLSFMIIYSGRLVWSNYFEFNTAAQTAIEFFIVAVLAPTLLVASHARNERNSEHVIDAIIFFGAVFVFTSIALRLAGVNEFVASEVDETIARQGFQRLNPIAVGFTSGIIVAAALFRTMSVRPGWYRLFCIAVMIAAIYLLLAAASRGPIVALAGSIFIAALVNRQARASLALAFFGGTLALIFAVVDVTALAERTRFSAAGSDVNSLARFDYWSEAFDAFLSSPIFGRDFEMPFTGGWPHNLWLEALMAVGIFGGAMFLALTIRAGWQSLTLLKFREVAVPIILLQSLIVALFSGSLWASNVLWPMLAIALTSTRFNVRDRAVGTRSMTHRP